MTRQTVEEHISEDIYEAFLPFPDLQTPKFKELLRLLLQAHFEFELVSLLFKDVETFTDGFFYRCQKQFTQARNNMEVYCSEKEMLDLYVEYCREGLIPLNQKKLLLLEQRKNLGAFYSISNFFHYLKNVDWPNPSITTIIKLGFLAFSTVGSPVADARPFSINTKVDSKNQEVAREFLQEALSHGQKMIYRDSKIIVEITPARNTEKNSKNSKSPSVEIFHKKLTELRKKLLLSYQGSTAGFADSIAVLNKTLASPTAIKAREFLAEANILQVKELFKKKSDLLKNLEKEAPNSYIASDLLAFLHMLNGEHTDRAVILYTQAFLQSDEMFNNTVWKPAQIAFLKALLMRISQISTPLANTKSYHEFLQHTKAIEEMLLLNDFTQGLYDFLKMDSDNSPDFQSTLRSAEENFKIMKLWSDRMAELPEIEESLRNNNLEKKISPSILTSSKTTLHYISTRIAQQELHANIKALPDAMKNQSEKWLALIQSKPRNPQGLFSLFKFARDQLLEITGPFEVLLSSQETEFLNKDYIEKKPTIDALMSLLKIVGKYLEEMEIDIPDITYILNEFGPRYMELKNLPDIISSEMTSNLNKKFYITEKFMPDLIEKGIGEALKWGIQLRRVSTHTLLDLMREVPADVIEAIEKKDPNLADIQDTGSFAYAVAEVYKKGLYGIPRHEEDAAKYYRIGAANGSFRASMAYSKALPRHEAITTEEREQFVKRAMLIAEQACQQSPQLGQCSLAAFFGYHDNINYLKTLGPEYGRHYLRYAYQAKIGLSEQELKTQLQSWKPSEIEAFHKIFDPFDPIAMLKLSDACIFPSEAREPQELQSEFLSRFFSRERQSLELTQLIQKMPTELGSNEIDINKIVEGFLNGKPPFPKNVGLALRWARFVLQNGNLLGVEAFGYFLLADKSFTVSPKDPDMLAALAFPFPGNTPNNYEEMSSEEFTQLGKETAKAFLGLAARESPQAALLLAEYEREEHHFDRSLEYIMQAAKFRLDDKVYFHLVKTYVAQLRELLKPYRKNLPDFEFNVDELFLRHEQISELKTRVVFFNEQLQKRIPTINAPNAIEDLALLQNEVKDVLSVKVPTPAQMRRAGFKIPRTHYSSIVRRPKKSYAKVGDEGLKKLAALGDSFASMELAQRYYKEDSRSFKYKAYALQAKFYAKTPEEKQEADEILKDPIRWFEWLILGIFIGTAYYTAKIISRVLRQSPKIEEKPKLKDTLEKKLKSGKKRNSKTIKSKEETEKEGKNENLDDLKANTELANKQMREKKFHENNIAKLMKLKTGVNSFDVISIIMKNEKKSLNEKLISSKKEKLEFEEKSTVKDKADKQWREKKKVYDKGIVDFENKVKKCDSIMSIHSQFTKKCNETLLTDYPFEKALELHDILEALEKWNSTLEAELKINSDAIKKEEVKRVSEENKKYEKAVSILKEAKEKSLKEFPALINEINEKCGDINQRLSASNNHKQALAEFQEHCNQFVQACYDFTGLAGKNYENILSDQLDPLVEKLVGAEKILGDYHPLRVEFNKKYEDIKKTIEDDLVKIENKSNSKNLSPEKRSNNNDNHVKVVTDKLGENPHTVYNEYRKGDFEVERQFQRELTEKEIKSKEQEKKLCLFKERMGWMDNLVKEYHLGFEDYLKDPKKDYEKHPLVRKYGLLYRLHEFQLLQLAAYHRRDQLDTPAFFCKPLIGDFANGFWNLLMHQFYAVKEDQLVACVMKNYHPDNYMDFSENTVLDVSRSSLYESLKLSEKNKLKRSVLDLINNLEALFEDFMTLKAFLKTKQYSEIPEYLDACKMAIMAMGDIYSDLEEITGAKDLLLSSSFKFLLNLLESCKEIRNKERHEAKLGDLKIYALSEQTVRVDKADPVEIKPLSSALIAWYEKDKAGYDIVLGRYVINKVKTFDQLRSLAKEILIPTDAPGFGFK